VQVWQTSNLRRLRLGEEEKERRWNKQQGKNIMSASATQGGHNYENAFDDIAATGVKVKCVVNNLPNDTSPTWLRSSRVT